MSESRGKQFRAALKKEQPLQIVGVINAYCALMAKRSGFQALYLSGAGVANASYGLPDLGMTQLDDVLVDAIRINQICDLPLLVDIDTGWEDVGQAVQQMTAVGVAAVHLEDQVAQKRCGHRPNKQLVSQFEMNDRIEKAVAAKTDPDFMIIARTDALASEGLEAAIGRAQAYVAAGAEAVFVEAVTELAQYEQFCAALEVPVLANITEFGRTPLFTLEQLRAQGVAMALYPLSAFRAMNQAALNVYQTLRAEGSQQSCLGTMQDRETLYDFLDYYAYEKALDNQAEAGD